MVKNYSSQLSTPDLKEFTLSIATDTTFVGVMSDPVAQILIRKVTKSVLFVPVIFIGISSIFSTSSIL